MTAEEFEKLLDLLGPGRDEAAAKYEATRRKLIRFFQWRGFCQAEDLTDQVLDRVARRLASGTEITSGDKYSYFQRVAHFKLLEALRDIKKEKKGADEQRKILQFREDPDRRLEALKRCLGELSATERKMVLGYYDGAVKSQQRKKVSEDHSLGLNALRIRVHRLRKRLEQCVRARLEPRP
jgi:hypothetical protein